MNDGDAQLRVAGGDSNQKEANEVLDEQLRLVTNAQLSAIIGSGIGAVIFGYAIWGWSWPAGYVVWTVALASVLLVPYRIHLRWTRRSADSASLLRRRVAGHFVSTLAFGSLWGVLAVVMYAPDPVRMTILSVALLATLASGTFCTAALLPLTYALSLPLLMPFAFYALWQPYELGRLVAGALLLTLFGMTLFAHDFHRTVLRSIRMRHENRRLAEALTEQRVRERTRVLEEASRHKSEFLATMSHELRTPLNAIIGYSEMLQEDAQAQGATALVPDLDKIHRAGKQLLELINAVLDMSKIEAGRMELHPETRPVADLLPEIAAVVEPLAARNGNRFTVSCADDAGTIRCDQVKLRQVLVNLLGNACKFTHGGIVTLTVSRQRQANGESLAFEAGDTGIGISAEQLSRLFNDYVQADRETARRYGGSGLGLALSRRLCRLMGGDIEVRSEVGRGSTFTVRLPAGETAEDPAVTATPARVAGRVLVIDDDPDVRDLLTRHLVRDGFRVVGARDGAEGLRLARSDKPDVITLDVLMPGLDGWSVLGELMADPVTRDIPVVIVSMLDDRQKGFALGATDYLTKPIDRQRLSALMRRYRRDRPVLVVEDDAEVRQRLREMLEADGYSVIESEAGRAALQRIPLSRPGTVVLALVMREMDGVEWTRELRRDPAWQELRVIVVAPRDLSAAEHARLNGTLHATLADGGIDREALLAEVRRLIAASADPSPRSPDGHDPADRRQRDEP